MGARRIRRNQRQFDMAKSRRVNGQLKTRERGRRQARMLALLKTGKFPYTPSILSWVSAELGKPSSQITPADVSTLVTAKAAAAD